MDYRWYEAGNLPFIAAEGRTLDEIKRKALTALRSFVYADDAPIGLSDLTARFGRWVTCRSAARRL